MRVVGVTIVRDAVRLEYPVVDAIRSVLPLVDEMIVNVGRSDDGTFEMIRLEFAGEKVVVLNREWDTSVGGAVLAAETNFAMRYLPSDWVVYAQADEILHEAGLACIRDAMTRYHEEEKIQGLTVEFVHHYGLPDIVASSRSWYRREVRIVKTGSGAESYHEAQGFRVGGERIRTATSGGTYHHYGWLRSCVALEQKSAADFRIYGRKAPRSFTTLPWEYGLKKFVGDHPKAMEGWLTGMEGRFPGIGPRSWSRRDVRMAIADVVERVVGRRMWEYRNYEEILDREKGVGGEKRL